MVSFILLQKKYAGIAQSVEQLIRNQQVVCSSHITSSTQSRTPVGVRLCVFIVDEYHRLCRWYKKVLLMDRKIRPPMIE